MDRTDNEQGLAEQRRGVFRFLLFLTQDEGLAEEITQETFKRVLAKSPSAGQPRDYGAWLRGVAKNVLRRYRQRPSPGGLVFNSELLDMAEGYFVRAGHAQEKDWEARGKALRTCIGRLSETNRALLLRRYQRGQDVKEIARVAGLEPNTVSKRLERIRTALRDCVKAVLKGETHE